MRGQNLPFQFSSRGRSWFAETNCRAEKMKEHYYKEANWTIPPLCSGSLRSRDKSRNAGRHHCIQPMPGLYAIDFIKRVLGKGRDVKIFSRARRSRWRG